MLKIKEICKEDYFSSIGAFKVNSLIRESLLDKKKIVLDFDGVRTCSPTFLNIVVDLIGKEFGYKVFGDDVKIKGLCADLKALILERLCS